MGEIFNELRAYKKALRAAYGINCPRCAVERPKTNPTLMLPGQRCKVDGYIDKRPRLTVAYGTNCRDIDAVMAAQPDPVDMSTR